MCHGANLKKFYETYYKSEKEDSPYEARGDIIVGIKQLLENWRKNRPLKILDIGSGPQTLLGCMLGVFDNGRYAFDKSFLRQLDYTSIDFASTGPFVGLQYVDELAGVRHIQADFTRLNYRMLGCYLGEYEPKFDLIVSNMAFDFIRYMEWLNGFDSKSMQGLEENRHKESFWKTLLGVDKLLLNLLKINGTIFFTLHHPFLLDRNLSLKQDAFVSGYLQNFGVQFVPELEQWSVLQHFQKINIVLGQQFRDRTIDEVYWLIRAKGYK